MAKIKVKICNEKMPFVADESAYVYADTRRDTRLGKFRTLVCVRNFLMEVEEWPRDRKARLMKQGEVLPSDFVAACIAAIPKKATPPATHPTPADTEFDNIYKATLTFLQSQSR